jgi:hypothetical protein
MFKNKLEILGRPRPVTSKNKKIKINVNFFSKINVVFNLGGPFLVCQVAIKKKRVERDPPPPSSLCVCGEAPAAAVARLRLSCPESGCRCLPSYYDRA